MKPRTFDLPKFWRPKLTSRVQLDAKLIHWDLIDRFTKGAATADDLWDWIETGLTYSEIMRLLIEDGTEFTEESALAIASLLDSHASVIQRYVKTGRIGFDYAELLAARAAAEVMDQLIEMDRHGIAEKAACWSTEQMQSIRKNS